MSWQLRELLLSLLASAPVDPRVPGGREAVWCSLAHPCVRNLKIEGAGMTR